MAAPVEHVVRARHGALVADLVSIAGRLSPLYPSASAFRFVFDPVVADDVVTASALALEHDVLLSGVVGEPLDVPTAQGSATSVLPGVRAGCRALTNGWWREAEDAFQRGAERLGTEPLLWFGAGMAAIETDSARGASHFERAARYLLPTDPAGSAYAAVVAAALHDRADDRSAAIEVLQRQSDALSAPCPSISLLLALLAPDGESQVSAALACDALLEADLHALGFDAAEAVKERRRTLEDEIRCLDGVTVALRAVDGGPSWSDEVSVAEPSMSGELLTLTRLEVGLWQRLRTCRVALRAGDQVVSDLQRARSDAEREVSEAQAVADRDLLPPTARSFLWSAVLIAGAIVVLSVIGAAFRSVVPSAAVAGVVLAGQTALVVQAVLVFRRDCWPHRAYRRARRAKSLLPALEAGAALLRRNEFDVRLRFEQASQEADSVIEDIMGRRRFVVPARPSFLRGGSAALEGSGYDAVSVDKRVAEH